MRQWRGLLILRGYQTTWPSIVDSDLRKNPREHILPEYGPHVDHRARPLPHWLRRKSSTCYNHLLRGIAGKRPEEGCEGGSVHSNSREEDGCRKLCRAVPSAVARATARDPVSRGRPILGRALDASWILSRSGQLALRIRQDWERLQGLREETSRLPQLWRPWPSQSPVYVGPMGQIRRRTGVCEL